MLEKTASAVETSLTLDDDASPLARLKREIVGVLVQQRDAATQFQAEVRSTLEVFKARKDEAARSTRHGQTFEDSVGELLDSEAKRVGDVCEHVGLLPGRSQRKFGDFVLELGPESASPGARIVVEAKAKNGYSIKDARTELAEARKNRQADVGLFVFDRAHAPKILESLQRIGADIFVVWDADDPTTDLYLRTAVSLARSLAHREVTARTRDDADLAALDGLVEAIAAHLTTLASIEKAARSVRKNGDAILKEAEGMRDALERETEELRKHVSALRESA